LHFTPKHASWLNQIECAFSDLQRCVLNRGSFDSKEDQQQKIYEYIWWHNENGKPFTWSYRPKSWSDNPAPTSGGRH
jgi:transposase